MTKYITRTLRASSRSKPPLKCLSITNLVTGKVAKENQIENVTKSEERKVKTIGKVVQESK